MVWPILIAALGGLAGGAALSSRKKGREFLLGRDPKLKRYEKFTPQQLSYMNQILSGQEGIQQSPLYQQGSKYISDLLKGKNMPNLDDYFAGSQEAFAAPMMRQFNQEILPGIASRFGALGTGGSGMMGSDFQNAAANAGASLQERLAAMHSGLQQQRAGMEMQKFGMQANMIPSLLGYAQMPYQQRMQAAGLEHAMPYIMGGSQGILGPTLAGVAGGLAQGYGMSMGAGG